MVILVLVLTLGAAVFVYLGKEQRAGGWGAVPIKERGRRYAGLAPVAIGAIAGATLWLSFVRWDLSEVDSAGRPLGNGGEDVSIGLVAIVLTGAGVILAFRQRTEHAAPWFVAGGLITWATLFAWRAGAAETVGANMFLAPLVLVVVPVSVGVPVLLGKVSSMLRRR